MFNTHSEAARALLQRIWARFEVKGESYREKVKDLETRLRYDSNYKVNRIDFLDGGTHICDMLESKSGPLFLQLQILFPRSYELLDKEFQWARMEKNRSLMKKL